MNITIQISNKDEAQEALNMLSAYLGNTSISTPAAKAIEDPKDNGPHLENEEPREVAEKPKRKAATKKPVKEKVEDETADEVIEEVLGKSEMDLKTLTGIAKDAVASSDRATVKEAISKYGEKLSAVDEADYAKLAEELKAL